MNLLPLGPAWLVPRKLKGSHLPAEASFDACAALAKAACSTQTKGFMRVALISDLQAQTASKNWRAVCLHIRHAMCLPIQH